jgi:hypothetical protein
MGEAPEVLAVIPIAVRMEVTVAAALLMCGRVVAL